MNEVNQNNAKIINNMMIEREKSIALFHDLRFITKIASGFVSLTLFSALVFFSLYEIKSALGINIFPNWSLFH